MFGQHGATLKDHLGSGALHGVSCDYSQTFSAGLVLLLIPVPFL
jgi:hypothetical protein